MDALGSLTDRISERISTDFSVVAVAVLVAVHTGLWNSLSGRPLDYGDLAKCFESDVPQWGACVVLNASFKLSVPEGLPLVAFPAVTARPSTIHQGRVPGACFSVFRKNLMHVKKR